MFYIRVFALILKDGVTVWDCASKQKDGVTVGDCASRRKDQQALSQNRGFDGFLEKPKGSCPQKDDKYVSVVPRVGRLLLERRKAPVGRRFCPRSGQMGLRDWRDSERKCPMCPMLLSCFRRLGKTLS